MNDRELDPTYIVWHPCVGRNSTDKTIVTVNVTPLGFDKIPNGPASFFDALLADIGLTYKASSWSILPYRSNYHADKETNKHWQERWLYNWRIAIMILEELTGQRLFDDEYFETYAYSFDFLLPEQEINCIIISDFRSFQDRDNAHDSILQSETIKSIRQVLAVSEPEFYYVDIGRDFFQLQIDLGVFAESFFQTDFPYATMVEKICESCGGITSFDQRANVWGEL
ncbi:hypothetical protein QNI19_08385 [Cytophagaceae bacterium DM2B3-1]|uniref:Uncharacterized protein n=1 Tax=Xanthocytophaga flava TaxID=3048013 RepID=A0ABT7CGT0_9BACT|nr:hypothetical protein [Xanthocytophaga flavus]MDJ1471069.1 hypothetical protein [Xanthocytophaga flavus]MDJ1492946.1 hypothetical protein [Xanthocytophaga flavus]